MDITKEYFYNDFAKILQRYRVRRGLTQKICAVLFEVSYSQYKRYENATQQAPLYMLVKFLKVYKNYLNRQDVHNYIEKILYNI